MNKLDITPTFSDIPPDDFAKYSHALIDRDGVLAGYGYPIEEDVLEKLHQISRNTRVTVVTNGTGDIPELPGIDTLRTRPPRIKQFPGVLRNCVDTPISSILVSDSPTEIGCALIAGMHGLYVKNSLNPHPVEAAFRTTIRPLRGLAYRLAGFERV